MGVPSQSGIDVDTDVGWGPRIPSQLVLESELLCLIQVAFSGFPSPDLHHSLRVAVEHSSSGPVGRSSPFMKQGCSSLAREFSISSIPTSK
jgi:hypothetical protein